MKLLLIINSHAWKTWEKMQFLLLLQLGLCNGPNKLLPLFLKNSGPGKIRLKLIEVELIFFAIHKL